MASGATYNITRFTRQVLKRYRRAPPSLVVHLYPQHFRFEHQHGNYAYDSPMKCFLEAIREQKLPTDLLDVLDQAKVVYYDGCLIVEVHDHRQTPPPQPHTLPRSKVFTFSLNPSSRDHSPYHHKSEVYRIVLAPNPATLWTELGILSSRFEERDELEIISRGGGGGANDVGSIDSSGLSEEEAVRMEAIILNRTVPPLCLDPSIQTSRIANSMLRATTLRPPKRKRFCGSGECGDDAADLGAGTEEGSKRERDEHEKLMKVGDEGVAKTKGPAFSRLAFIQAYRERQNNPTANATSSSSLITAQPGSAVTSIRLGQSTTAAGNSSSSSTPNPHAAVQAVQQQAGAGGGMRNSRGASPAVSISSQQHQGRNVATNHKKRTAGGGGGMGADQMSDGGGSTMSGSVGGVSTAAQQKKAKKLAAQAASEANDPTLPNDPVERERVVQERRKLASQQKKQQSLKKKEKKRLEQQMQQQQNDLQVGAGVGGGNPQAKFTWSGA